MSGTPFACLNQTRRRPLSIQKRRASRVAVMPRMTYGIAIHQCGKIQYVTDTNSASTTRSRCLRSFLV